MWRSSNDPSQNFITVPSTHGNRNATPQKENVGPGSQHRLFRNVKAIFRRKGRSSPTCVEDVASFHIRNQETETSDPPVATIRIQMNPRRINSSRNFLLISEKWELKIDGMCA